MKYNHDRLMEARKTVALVSACSVSIEQAIGAARSSVGGTVFDAKLKEIEQQLVWRVKLVVGGRRVKVYVDARSGRVIDAKAEILDHKGFGNSGFTSREIESSTRIS
jgi:uncharacterized membrane protein YkoI